MHDVLKRYQVQVLREAGLTLREVAEKAGVSARSVDRILHHATVVNIKGDSYRMKSRRRTGSLVQIPETRTAEVSVKG